MFAHACEVLNICIHKRYYHNLQNVYLNMLGLQNICLNMWESIIWQFIDLIRYKLPAGFSGIINNRNL